MSIQNLVRIETHNNRVIELLQVGTEYRVDSRTVAKGLNIQHEYFMETLVKYQARLEHFGAIRFETGSKENGNTGGYQPKYALLNRNQVLFAITLSRNTEEVLDWKEAIIDALDQLEKQVKGLKASKSQRQIEAPEEVLKKKVLHIMQRKTKAARTKEEQWISPAVIHNQIKYRYTIEEVEEMMKTLNFEHKKTKHAPRGKYRLK